MRNRYKRVRVYVHGRGFVDIAKVLFDKLLNNSQVQTFATTALKKGVEVAGDKVGSFVATKVADKVLPQNNSLRAIEELEKKIKRDVDNYSGRGFKMIR